MFSTDLLPVELWEKIIRKYLGSRQWMVLSKTCSLFRTIALGELYFAPGIWDDEVIVGHGIASKQTMCMPPHELMESSKLAGLVRKLTVYGPNTVGPAGIMPYPEPHEQTLPIHQLPLFTNMRWLTFTDMFIDVEARAAIHALPRLESLRLQACTTDPKLLEIPITIDSKRTLSLAIWWPKTVDGWTAISPARVQTLAINDSIDAQVDRSFYLSFINSGQSDTLETFDFRHGIVADIILDFLASTPQLRTIMLPSGQASLSALPPTCLPLLENFNGPSELCEAFIRGRPVHTVTLRLEDEVPNDVLRFLQFSTVSVQDLTLELCLPVNQTPRSLGSYMKHAPATVCRLAWDLVDKESLMSCVHIMGRFPDLHTLDGLVFEPGMIWDIQPVSWKEQWKLVQACSEAACSLRHVVFDRRQVSLHNDGKWNKKRDGEWEYYRVEFVDISGMDFADFAEFLPPIGDV